MLNKKQTAAVDKVKKWYETGNEQVFKLAGYAGTGKTYTAGIIAEEVRNAAFCAFTGKAALVMRQRKMPATTIHSLIYNVESKFVDTPSGKKKRLVSTLKDYLDPEPDLIIVDESSMVGDKLLKDLMSFDIPILAVGDPFQLPPVGDKESELLQDPDITLDEIMRQDEGSPIVYLADKIRRGVPLDTDESVDGVIWQLSKNRLKLELPNIIDWADQVIAGRNQSVSEINNIARTILHYTDDEKPEDGEKIICKRNDWEQILVGDEITYALVNGMIGYCNNIRREEKMEQTPWERKHDLTIYDYFMSFRPVFENKAEFKNLKFEPGSLFETSKKRQWMKDMIFQFAYCITCHSAQGSEWDKVVLYDDSWADNNDSLFQARWRYTGITRAAKQLVWMR